MNARQRRLHERAQRVVLFVESRSEDFPDGSRGAGLLTQIKAELATLGAHDVARMVSASKKEQGSAGRRTTREELRSILSAVMNTGQTLGLDRPEMRGLFSFPDADRSDQTLVTSARAAADAATPFVSLFVECGLPPTFIADLRALADSLENYISLQAEGLAGRADSNVSTEETLKHITGLIERLDNIIRNKYRDDPATLLAWERARHVENAPQHQDEDASPPPPTGTNS